MGVCRFSHSVTLHIVLACDDCRMAVGGGAMCILVAVYPLFEGETPHASALSKMPSSAVVGSLNLTISVRQVAFSLARSL